MAMRRVVVFLVVMVAVWETCNGACNLDVQKLMACKDAVIVTNPTNPSPGCCNMIKGLSRDDISCLCDYKTNKATMLRNLGINPDRCTQLPKMCGLSIPINC